MCKLSSFGRLKHLLFFLAIVSCVKDTDPIPVKFDRYTIYLGDDYKIKQVDHFVSDSLIEVKKFNYMPQSVRMEVTDRYN